MTAAAQLRDWIDRRRVDQAEAAEMFGIHEAYISMLLSGKRTPSLQMAVKIEALTGIPAKAWLESKHHISKKARKRGAEMVPVNKA